ncbi:MAG: cistern family PEP-CTERM protein [Phenylobacterium sp.]|jgi:hypothetical protein|uniref:cistern family PEP-CTERM protein n=1 Tax=Phenylobacterium sp. TaxID=1871053 RepID=UPI00391CA427
MQKNFVRALALTVAIGASAVAGNAAASTVLNWDGTVGQSYTLDFNGFNDTVGDIAGLTAQITYTFTGMSGNAWNFDYAISNTSSDPTTASRISSFGFDVSPAISGGSSTGTYAFTNVNSNIPNGIGVVDICFKAVSQGNCTGNGGGLTYGQNGSGTLTLNFASLQTAIDFSNLYVRYQSVNAPGVTGGSAVGVPVTAVPEPGTWALMIAGFGLVGAALRSRKSLALA